MRQGKRSMSRFCRSALLVVVVAGLALGFAWPSQAVVLKVKSGVTQASMIWQTSPPAFSDARWADVGLALLLGRVTLGMSTAVVDFQTMRYSYPPSFDLSVFIRTINILGSSLSVGGGAVITPASRWVAWYMETDVNRPLALNTEAFIGIGVETTAGTPGSFFTLGHPAGTCIFLNVGLSYTLRVL